MTVRHLAITQGACLGLMACLMLSCSSTSTQPSSTTAGGTGQTAGGTSTKGSSQASQGGSDTSDDSEAQGGTDESSSSKGGTRNTTTKKGSSSSAGGSSNKSATSSSAEPEGGSSGGSESSSKSSKGGSSSSSKSSASSSASGGTSTGGSSSSHTSAGGTTTGATTGGTGTGTKAETGECQKGTTKGNEVVIIGESFIAMSSIPEQLTAKAKAAGSLQSNESYIDKSVSGTTLSNNQIPSQYTGAQASNDIRFVVMDGGGNDCLQANNPTGALNAAKSLFETMAKDGVEKVQYFFYPDPVGGSFSSLKSCLDTLRPQMQALCEGLTAPKCYWLDLRPTWNGHGEYTSDGIHPTEAGSTATANVIWDAMVKNCIAQ